MKKRRRKKGKNSGAMIKGFEPQHVNERIKDHRCSHLDQGKKSREEKKDEAETDPALDSTFNLKETTQRGTGDRHRRTKLRNQNAGNWKAS